MRQLVDHKVNPANDAVEVHAVDEPGSGGANHVYHVTWADKDGTLQQRVVDFQNGPINEAGVNGLTHEILLAIVADRLRAFQQGPFATRYNALALTHIEEAQNWLNRRTLERMRRGVEGTHKV
ncbi:MAG: ABC transporter ATPase [Caulobacteraceae bacterium]|nr:ABC transporter ATPase [Caulobacteraceae bacterium]